MSRQLKRHHPQAGWAEAHSLLALAPPCALWPCEPQLPSKAEPSCACWTGAQGRAGRGRTPVPSLSLGLLVPEGQMASCGTWVLGCRGPEPHCWLTHPCVALPRRAAGGAHKRHLLSGVEGQPHSQQQPQPGESCPKGQGQPDSRQTPEEALPQPLPCHMSHLGAPTAMEPQLLGP